MITRVREERRQSQPLASPPEGQRRKRNKLANVEQGLLPQVDETRGSGTASAKVGVAP